MDRYISIKEASLIFGVTTTTLRRWKKNSLFECHHRTLGNHRRYKLSDILTKINPSKQDNLRKTLCYARVSSHDQKNDLLRQTNVLSKYCLDNKIENIEIINDIGSGLNFKKKFK